MLPSSLRSCYRHCGPIADRNSQDPHIDICQLLPRSKAIGQRCFFVQLHTAMLLGVDGHSQSASVCGNGMEDISSSQSFFTITVSKQSLALSLRALEFWRIFDVRSWWIKKRSTHHSRRPQLGELVHSHKTSPYVI